ncbi:hypothetical protein ACOI1A_09655, partial [Corynebacterium glutamicum]
EPTSTEPTSTEPTSTEPTSTEPTPADDVETSSVSEKDGWIAVIVGLLALIGGGIAVLFQGLITIPGLVLPKL